MPLPTEAINEVQGLVYHGLMPAIVEDNLVSFAAYLNRLQHVGFKRYEICAQHPAVDLLLNDLATHELAAGMSSTGPLVFAITRAGDRAATSRVQAIASAHSSYYLGCYQGRNSGAIFKTESI